MLPKRHRVLSLCIGAGSEYAIFILDFATGTLVVWDEDLLSEDVIRVYKASDPENPTIYRRGKTAEVEPAVPRWRMVVHELCG